MTSNPAFVGVYLSSGRKPFTLARLDDDLNLMARANGDMQGVEGMISELDSAIICIVADSKPKSTRSLNTNSIFYEQLEKMSFRPYSRRNDARQWIKVDAEEAFSALLPKKPLSRRTLEGRIQRALILYEQGLQIEDPMDLFEEITRYKLMQGIRPFEGLYSAKELDALVAAYVAWTVVNKPGYFLTQGEFILPGQE